MNVRILVALAACIGLTTSASFAQSASGRGAADADSAAEDATAKRYADFEKLLSGAKLVGQFTILGRDMANLPKEEYTINSVKKMPNGDFWLFNARIKYGGKDVTVPLPLQVKWADDTPIITLTDIAVPGLGTFSSRVVFYNNKYAGTWTHGEVGGHLFGVIEKPEADGDAGTTDNN